MKRDVLISIRPEWCAKIISGIKELEIRRTRPKIEPPFKCHVYCTKDKHGGITCLAKPDGGYVFSYGNVIMDFTCDKIIEIGVPYPAYRSEMDKTVLEKACMSYGEIHAYAGYKTVYGLHISELHIYDHSKSLNEYGMIRPPQSWCYIYADERGKI